MKSLHHLSLLCLLFFVSALSTGCASDKQVIAQANQFHGGIQPAVMNDPELAGYLQKVGDRIIVVAKELDAQGYGPPSHKGTDSQWMFGDQMKFHFVNSKTLNAFTTGGDHMYIYTELFQQCKSEDELAAVMAHEFAHVYARHVQNGMNRQTALGVTTLGVGLLAQSFSGDGNGGTSQSASTAAGAAAMAATLVGNGFTRKDEGQADDLGFNFYCHAGWDPNRFGDFFQHMIDAGYDKGPEFLSDHPSLANRVKASHAKVAALPAGASEWRKPPVADASRFALLQGRARELSTKVPNDQSLQNSQQLLAAMPRSCLTPAIQPDQKVAQQNLIARAKAEQQQQQQRPPAQQKKS